MEEQERVLSKIKDYEEYLKSLIVKEYGQFLPKAKIDDLLEKNYTKFELLASGNSNTVRRELLDEMFHDLIHKEGLKRTVTLFDGNILEIEYGMTLEQALVNYYSYSLSNKYGIKIGDIPGLEDDLEAIETLYKSVENTFHSTVFNEDVVKLLTKANVEAITKKYDEAEAKQYLMHVTQVSGMGAITKQEQNDLIKENVERELSVQIVWLNDKKHIKYTDPYGEIHVIDIDKSPKVEEYYKAKLAALGPDEKLDPEKFFRELQDYAKEMEMTPTDDVKEEDLNSRQVDMFKFIQSTKSLEKAREQDIMTHNPTMEIHAMQGPGDLVATQPKDDYVEARVIKNGDAEASNYLSHAGEDISSQLISKEEFIRLNNKLFNGEMLSDEEKEAIRRAAPKYAEEVFNDQMEEQQEGGKPLVPMQNPYNTGFTLKTFALYFIVILFLIATTVAIIILK